MSAPRILLFDSGMGGLTVAQAVARQLPDATLIYAADNVGFPYGAWEEAALVARIRSVMAQLIGKAEPDVVVVACNTASTIALADLRATFNVPFVGTVPAIKPAAAQTGSGIIGVLATPGTVKREYTRALIDQFAAHCEVVLHGAENLAAMTEAALRGEELNQSALRQEIAPVFVERGGKRTDVVVLGCTHYPLIADAIASVAPWPVTLIDPAPAIARRVADVADETPRREGRGGGRARHGTVILTGPAGDGVANTYAKLGFSHLVVTQLSV
jgi:glutamate racemase